MYCSNLKEKIICEEITITPQMAQNFIKRIEVNRPLSERIIEKYAKAILNGQWDLNGESIKFSGNNKLLDGQHRLHAIIKANRSIRTLIMRGVPDESFITLDSGKRRSAGDIFAIKKDKYYNTIAAALKLYYTFQFVRSGDTNGFNNPKYTPSSHDLIDLRNRYPEIIISAEIAPDLRYLIQPRITAFCHLIFSQINKEETNIFFKKLSEGIELNKGDPIYTLRERLIQDRGSQSKLPIAVKIALIIKAWNYFRKGEKLLLLRWSQPNNEPFPIPI